MVFLRILSSLCWPIFIRIRRNHCACVCFYGKLSISIHVCREVVLRSRSFIRKVRTQRYIPWPSREIQIMSEGWRLKALLFYLDQTALRSASNWIRAFNQAGLFFIPPSAHCIFSANPSPNSGFLGFSFLSPRLSLIPGLNPKFAGKLLEVVSADPLLQADRPPIPQRIMDEG